MNYKIRSGIVRIKICGEYLLVPTRKASETCPKIMKLSLMGAALWEEIEKGNGTDNICIIFQKLAKKPREEIEARINSILEDLCEKSYLIRVEEET